MLSFENLQRHYPLKFCTYLCTYVIFFSQEKTFCTYNVIKNIFQIHSHVNIYEKNL